MAKSFEEKIREEARERKKEFKKNIRESNYGLLKLIGLELTPVLWGASLAGIGRSTGQDYLPAVPLGIDFMTTGSSYSTPQGLWNTVKYGIGVALVYSDKIYLACQTLIEKSI